MNISDDHQFTGSVIGAAIAVHRQLGPGLDEIDYEEALSAEFSSTGIAHRRQVPLPLTYKGVRLDCGYRLDILVNERLPLELKAVAEVLKLHKAQTLTYQKIGRHPLALLINFRVAVLKDGVVRLAETRPWSPPSPSVAEIEGGSRFDDISRGIVDSAVEVHRQLGPGLLGSSYRACLCHELTLRGISFEVGKEIPVFYHGTPLSAPAEIPLLVADEIPVFPIISDSLSPVHTAIALARMRQGGWRQSLILNFNSTRMVDGIQRVVL